MSEGSSELGHVQSKAPGRASGAVDFLLNILLLRWTPAAASHRQHRAQEHQTGPTGWHHTGRRRTRRQYNHGYQRLFLLPVSAARRRPALATLLTWECTHVRAAPVCARAERSSSTLLADTPTTGTSAATRRSCRLHPCASYLHPQHLCGVHHFLLQVVVQSSSSSSSLSSPLYLIHLHPHHHHHHFTWFTFILIIIITTLPDSPSSSSSASSSPPSSPLYLVHLHPHHHHYHHHHFTWFTFILIIILIIIITTLPDSPSSSSSSSSPPLYLIHLHPHHHHHHHHHHHFTWFTLIILITIIHRCLCSFFLLTESFPTLNSWWCVRQKQGLTVKAFSGQMLIIGVHGDWKLIFGADIIYSKKRMKKSMKHCVNISNNQW